MVTGVAARGLHLLFAEIQICMGDEWGIVAGIVTLHSSSSERNARADYPYHNPFRDFFCLHSLFLLSHRVVAMLTSSLHHF